MEFPVPGVQWDSYSKTSEGIRVGVVGIRGFLGWGFGSGIDSVGPTTSTFH